MRATPAELLGAAKRLTALRGFPRGLHLAPTLAECVTILGSCLNATQAHELVERYAPPRWTTPQHFHDFIAVELRPPEVERAWALARLAENFDRERAYGPFPFPDWVYAAGATPAQIGANILTFIETQERLVLNQIKAMPPEEQAARERDAQKIATIWLETHEFQRHVLVDDSMRREYFQWAVTVNLIMERMSELFSDEHRRERKSKTELEKRMSEFLTDRPSTKGL